MRNLLLSLVCSQAHGELMRANEAVVGNVRIQALSQTLVRIEPQGPQGFEDRTTFMVTNREFEGVPLTVKGKVDGGTLLQTEFYSILLRDAADPVTAPTCSSPIRNADLADAVRSDQFPNGTVVGNRGECCEACESDSTCSTWIYNPWSAAAELSTSDVPNPNCWPVKSFSASFGAEGTATREFGCSSRGCALTRAKDDVMFKTDVAGGKKTDQHPFGANVSSRQACFELCDADPSCVAWVHALPKPDDQKSILDKLKDRLFPRNCWPIKEYAGKYSAGADWREVGCSSRGCRGELPTMPAFSIMTPDGQVIYDSATDAGVDKNLLHWPEPLTENSYVITDYPRFFAPDWGAATIPADVTVDPELLSTNGYDFNNNVPGDAYIFLLGDTLTSWQASREEFVKLGGGSPLLPDYAYGTWFTFWNFYTESSARSDVKHWNDLALPLDIWGLDMNWRFTDNNEDKFYDYPNTTAFPNFTEWFEFMRDQGLRTYFNDHPYPVAKRHAGGLQTSKEEVEFRWDGLTKWMDSGLSFWWFDHNWYCGIPPPMINVDVPDGNWDGLDNAAWGAHVFFKDVSEFNKRVRDPKGDKFNGGRPMTLNKFGRPDWLAGRNPMDHAESPAHHRYPVWWIGDYATLQGSVETMVDSGLYGFKPFVHADCGGDYRGSSGDLMRWTAHCAFGSVLRFHGADHRAWTYDDHTVDVVRSYLNMRYKLVPSLIAAGQKASETGAPLVARGDFFWPEHSESRSHHQYIFLEDLLVAPIFSSDSNITSRSVWIPSGDWEDFWDGSVVTGPQTVTVSQPYERQPMWYRTDGALLVLADKPALRVEEQDWSSLTLEAFLSTRAHMTERHVFERSTQASDVPSTSLSWHYDGQGAAELQIGASDIDRSWVLRVHLRQGQRVVNATLDGEPVAVLNMSKQQPGTVDPFTPLGGRGAAAAPKAGPVVEMNLQSSTGPRTVSISIGTDADEVTLII